jgi:hypothetical protein
MWTGQRRSLACLVKIFNSRIQSGRSGAILEAALPLVRHVLCDMSMFIDKMEEDYKNQCQGIRETANQLVVDMVNQSNVVSSVIVTRTAELESQLLTIAKEAIGTVLETDDPIAVDVV